MPSKPFSPSMLVLAGTVAQGSGRSPPPAPSCTIRTRPGRSVTKSLPSGARSTAHGARSPDATSCTFSTTAGPTRGDGVEVGVEVAGGAVVGIGIVVRRGEGVDAATARRADQLADIVERSMVAAHARDEAAADLDDVDGKLLDQMRVFVGGVVEGHANALGAHELEDRDRRVRIVREGPRVCLHDQQLRTSRDFQG